MPSTFWKVKEAMKEVSSYILVEIIFVNIWASLHL
jgi:hypothetical protein